MTTQPTTTMKKPKPWQRRRERPYRREAIVLDVPPLAQIDIYDSLCVLTRRAGPGQAWRSYPINPSALAQALAGVPTGTGLLPPHTLATGHLNGAPFYVLYVPPRRVDLQITIAGRTCAQPLTTPPLIWGGWRRDYRVLAWPGPEQPTQPRGWLAHAPFPNCYADGRVCWGDSDPRPEASGATMLPALDLFLTGSAFNNHIDGGKSVRKPGSILALYAELDVEQPYPLDDLIPVPGLDLRPILAGGLWR